MGILSMLVGVFDPISKITSAITSAQIERSRATTDRDKIASDERIKTLSLQRDVLIRTADSKLGAFVRLAIAFPFVVYINKIVLYDKLWTGGAGSTDPLSAGLENIMLAAVGYYFLRNLINTVKR